MNFHYIFRSFSQQSAPGSRYVKPLKGFKEYLVQKCFAFVEGYERILETKFPSAFKIYQVFSVGTKTLYTDITEYIRISSTLSAGKSVRDLQRKELEVYFQVPKDLIKVGPILLLAALPFANYVILPVIYLFPPQMSHLPLLDVATERELLAGVPAQEAAFYRPVFRNLQARVQDIQDDALRNRCQDIFYKIGSGVHPSVDEIVQVKRLFIDKPYGIFNMSLAHLHNLCRMHNVSTLPGKQWRLWKHAGFVREMDLAIHREGWSSMSQHDLRQACFLRGLSPVGLSKEEMITWLLQWIQVAQNCDSHSLSLLLHCPIFCRTITPLTGFSSTESAAEDFHIFV